MKKVRILLAMMLMSCAVIAQSDYNNFVVERKNIQKQMEEMLKTDKAFKNKNATAEFQALVRRLLELDDKIILSANYTVNELQKDNVELQKKANVQPKTIIKTIPGKSSVLTNDSVYDALFIAQNKVGNLSEAMKAKDEAFMTLLNKSDSLISANKKIQAKFDALAIDNKALEEKNIVLIIFNSLVALGLILSLFFLLRKPVAKKMLLNSPASARETQPVSVTSTEPVRKKPEVNTEPVIKVSSEGILAASHDALDFKLDQIEKLARLKEKGYLTDEEFVVQKKQILGS